MDELLGEIFRIYVDDDQLEFYQARNDDYQRANKRMAKMEEAFLESLKGTEYYDYVKKYVQDYFDAFIDLVDVYRYQDFEQAFTLGVLFSQHIAPKFSDELLDKIKDIIERHEQRAAMY